MCGYRPVLNNFPTNSTVSLARPTAVMAASRVKTLAGMLSGSTIASPWAYKKALSANSATYWAWKWAK